MMQFAPNQVIVDLRLECVLDLVHAAGEVDPAPSGRDLLNPEAMRLQPSCHRGKIAVADSKAPPELLGCQPFVKLRGTGVVLRRKQRF